MKYLLYIFNFETLSLKSVKIFSRSAALVLAVFLFIEIMLRVLIPANQTPTGHWRSHEIRLKAHQLEKLSDVDIMFTGNSLASANVSPVVFDKEVMEHGINITSFNAGITGPDYEGVSIGFEKVFWKRKQSKYVVFIVSPYDLHESSKYWRKRTASFIKTFNIPNYKAAAIDFFSNFWIFGFRNEIRELLKTFSWKYEKDSFIGIRGFTPMKKGCKANLPDSLYIYKEGPISKSFSEIVKTLSNQGVHVVIVEALLSSKYRKLNQGRLDSFYSLIKELKQEYNLTFLQINEIIPDDHYFMDPFHLNEEGAKKFSRNLAQKFLNLGLLKFH
ncbi:MAG: hypothetical protein ACM339_01300 [Ignavibacteria bacterium]